MRVSGTLLLTTTTSICLFLVFGVQNCDARQPGQPINVIKLNEDNWRLLLQDEWMVQFHAPWCPACRSLTNVWDALSTWSEDLDISVAKIDVTEAPALSGRFFVTALPTIFHVVNGEFRQYRGSRELLTLQKFVEEKKWRSIEPISAWQYPDSIQMTIVANFFKLSHFLKDVNSYMHEEYKLPIWLAYGIFAIVTVFLGAVLGLIFVCIVDFIFPPKGGKRKTFAQVQSTEGEVTVEGDDLDEDASSSSPEDESDSKEEEKSDDEKKEQDDEDESNKKSKQSPPSSPKATKDNNTETLTATGAVDGAASEKSDVRKRKQRKAD